MKKRTLWCGMIVCAAGATCACAGPRVASDMPRLEKRDGMTKLIVDGRPFLCVAGEVSNAASSDTETMKTILPRLAQAHLNTILTVVSWDLIEPEEGRFDFSMIDYQIEAARASRVRLVVLWMASWKNGLSHFVPEWVKRDQDRFPRVVNAEGNTLEILSTFSRANRQADARAFAALMRHIRRVDSKEHTVIAVQVENEVGVLGSTRDYCGAANEAFGAPVPRELMDALQRNRDRLLPELKEIWRAAGFRTRGTWEEVFGKNVPRPDRPVPNSPNRPVRAPDAELFNRTDEIFMAWHYARYIGAVAAQGKREYPLPMYVNAWIVQPNDLGPGDYPSGGPEPLVHDIWRTGAPAIDILAPDIYLTSFAQIVQTFARGGNPAFIPETRQDGDNAWAAFTQLNALCYSPFGVDRLSPDSGFSRTYELLGGLSGAIAEAQGRADAIRLITPAPGEGPGRVEMGDYVFDFTGVPGRRGGDTPGEAPRPDAGPGLIRFMQGPYLIIVRTAPDEYYFATNGSHPFRVSPKTPGRIAAPASVDRGRFINGRWVSSRRLNGDDIMGRGYDLSDAAARAQAGTEIPLGGRRWGDPRPAQGQTDPPTILRVRFYCYR
ncbi:MAG: DUF5597 domain-containing protein [Phycisphaerae bacterium]|nr:DUF5597 domain-containing protein [Phycisphaerae bacterium]